MKSDHAIAERFFGELPGEPPGSTWATRQQLSQAGVHRLTMGGISGTAAEGADSIVVSGGYEDDEDLGDEILYTGAGGMIPEPVPRSRIRRWTNLETLD